MSKKNTGLQPFSKYAILDLPIEVCIQRAIDQYEDNPLADAKLVHEDRLDVSYSLSTVEYSTVDAMATLMRWQGTQTRVMFYVQNHAEDVSSGAYLFNIWDYVSILLVLLAIPLCTATAIIYIKTPNANASMLFVFAALAVWALMRMQIPQPSQDVDTLHKRVNAVWSGLLKIVSNRNAVESKLLVEQGDQDVALYEDYLSAGAKYQQRVNSS